MLRARGNVSGDVSDLMKSTSSVLKSYARLDREAFYASISLPRLLRK